jgi:protein-S-isoprenylcysteine O-methyltransferase Ste14
MFLPLVYSIFLPLRLGAAWFYAGLAVYLVGMAFVALAQTTFATTPPDKPATKGIYRFSRNPIDFGFSLILVSLGIAGASWLVLLLAIVLLGLMGAGGLPKNVCVLRSLERYTENI